jgi:transposase
MNKRKRYSSEEKTKILREHLDGGVAISDLSEKYGVHPNAIYKWKKDLFENASDVIAPNKKTVRREAELQRRIEELERTLQIRESLIADIVADSIEMKKKLNGAK